MRSSCCVSSGGRGPQCRVASAGTAAPVGRPAILMLPCRPLSTPADPHRSEPALEAPMAALDVVLVPALRSEEHTSELQSLMRISYAVFCLKKKNNNIILQ